MAVSPDLLLNIKAPATAAKAASQTSKPAAQPSRDEPSSFANVYARERQAKPAERSEPAARPVRDKPVSEKPSQETAEADGSDKPAVAEAGKELPVDGVTAESEDLVEAEEAELDPLLLLGLGDSAQPAPDPLPLSLPTGSEFLAGLPQAQAAVDEADGESEELLLGQRSVTGTLSVAEKALAAQAATPDKNVADTEPLATTALLGEEFTGEEGADSGSEENFGTLLEQLDAPKESRSAASDTVLNRLNPLTQAIAQQNLQAQQIQRPALVPGQPVQIQQSGWSEAVVDRVMWLSSQNLKSAEIQLDPAELGRMEVRIDMNKDQTQVTFLSPHAGVRDALEGQMHRLRDMFAQQGMTMDVNVSDQSLARGWQGQGGGESRGNGGRGGSAGAEEEVVRGSVEISSSRASGDRGLVDYYA